MVSSSIVTEFPVTREKAYQHIINMLDCDKWMDEEDWLGSVFLIENGTCVGLEATNPHESMEPITFPIIENIINEKVIYGPSYANSKNVVAEAITFFPFRDMRHAVYFEDSEFGCKVTQVISYKPKWLIGWFTCKFILSPQVSAGLKKQNDKLSQYLSNA
jgi:hypothetical protein